MEGVHNETLIELKNTGVVDVLSQKYLENVNKKYEDAQPEYEKERMKKRKKSLISWTEELKAVSKNPKMIAFLSYKKRLYDSFLRYCKAPNLNEKYIILFLHFQPERTSMPEGRMYSNQIHIVNTIHRALPVGWKLYVKEHPATFTNSMLYDPRYRNLSFYKYISQLPNTILVDLSVDSFNLIDNCQCLATITGTVGGEGLLRAKPVLTFGNAPYRNHKFVFDINSVQDVERALEAIRNVRKEEIKFETYNNYVPYVLNNSISGIDTDKITLDECYSDDIRNLSIGRCLGYLLSNA